MRQSRSRSGPSAVRAQAVNRSPRICTPTSGLATTLRYHAGCVWVMAEPDATST